MINKNIFRDIKLTQLNKDTFRIQTTQVAWNGRVIYDSVYIDRVELEELRELITVELTKP